MTQKTIKRGLIDWVVIGVLILVPLSLTAFAILAPKSETRAECYRRAGEEIASRYRASGKTTIQTTEEIEAIASEVKIKCQHHD